MKFSIIVPVYNAEKYIENTISETLKQSFDSVEMILVDDGSTDRSGVLCDALAAEFTDRVQVIHQKNQGQLAARCNGILAARGEYCLFLDADDLFVEDAFKHLHNVIEKYHNPDMVTFSFYYDRNGKLEAAKKIQDQEILYEGERLQELYSAFFTGTMLNSMCTKAVKRETALKSVAGYEAFTSLRCAEDRYQSLRMLQAARRIVYLPEPLYRYRILEGSTTRQYTVDAISRFNTAILYPIELECIKTWGMDVLEWEKRLQASWVGYTLYILDLFYYQVPKRERKLVLTYPWKTFLPQEIGFDDINTNPFVTDRQKLLWNRVECQHRKLLRLYFAKKKAYQSLRRIKRTILRNRR